MIKIFNYNFIILKRMHVCHVMFVFLCNTTPFMKLSEVVEYIPAKVHA